MPDLGKIFVLKSFPKDPKGPAGKKPAGTPPPPGGGSVGWKLDPAGIRKQGRKIQIQVGWDLLTKSGGENPSRKRKKCLPFDLL